VSTDKSLNQSNDIAGEIRSLLAAGSSGVLVTVLASEVSPAGAKLLVTGDEKDIGDLGSAALNAAARIEAAKFSGAREATRTLKVGEFAPELKELSETLVLFERIETEPHVVIAGAGHVGAALARLAALIGYRVTLIDDRAEFVARNLFNGESDQAIELVAAQSWVESIRAAIGTGRGVSVAIVTRGHKQDEDCLRATISGGPDYIGMIGSKRRTNIVLDKLRAEGFTADQLSKVRAPIGLDIGAVSPEEVALAILAEIVGERRGGSGAPLSSWRRID
jgi:xanthine dehydrogenase accessory factor